MGLSTNTFTYAGGDQTFTLSLSLGYLEEADITAYVVGELDGGGNQIYRAFTFDSEFVVRITDPLTVNDQVVVERTVSKTVPEVDLEASGDVTGRNIMILYKQVFMAQQELLDGRVGAFNPAQSAQDAQDARDSAIAAAASAAAAEAAAAASALSIDVAELIQRDGSVPFTGIQTLFGPPTADLHAATKKYVDDTVGGGGAMLLDGSAQMTGPMLLKAATDPVLDDHAARKKYVDDQVALKANLAGPTFTGIPAADTAAVGTNTTQLATTAFVIAELAASGVGAGSWTFVENVYDFAVDGTIATKETSNFADGFEYRLDYESLSHNYGSNSRVSLELYKATDLAYTAEFHSDANASASQLFVGRVYLRDVRESITLHNFEGNLERDTVQTPRVFSGGAVMTAQKILKARVGFQNGDMDGGVVRLYKRAL